MRTKTVQDPGASYRELKSRESVWVKSGPDRDEWSVRTYPFEVTVHRTIYRLGLYIIKLWVSEQPVVELGDDNELVIK